MAVYNAGLARPVEWDSDTSSSDEYSPIVSGVPVDARRLDNPDMDHMDVSNDSSSAEDDVVHLNMEQHDDNSKISNGQASRGSDGAGPSQPPLERQQDDAQGAAGEPSPMASLVSDEEYRPRGSRRGILQGIMRGTSRGRGAVFHDPPVSAVLMSSARRSRPTEMLSPSTENPTGTKPKASSSVSKAPTESENKMDPTDAEMAILKKENSLATCLSRLYLEEDLSDVHFLIPKKNTDGCSNECGYHRIPGHKFILATRSDVFKVMFYGHLAEKDEVELKDIEVNGFKSLLKYCYTDTIEINGVSVISAGYAAKKYCVDHFEKCCWKFLAHELSTGDILKCLSQALKTSCDEDILNLLWTKVNESTKDIIEDPSFLMIDKSMLEFLVSRDDLSISEVDLFRSVIRWSFEECRRQSLEPTATNVRTVLGDVIHQIRFPAMPSSDFAFKTNLSEGYLTPEEQAAIFSHFLNPSETDANIPFPTTERCGLIFPVPTICGNSTLVDSVESSELSEGTSADGSKDESSKEYTVRRFVQPTIGRLCAYDEVHRIDFTVSSPIILTGIGVYGTRCEAGSERSIYVELYAAETMEKLASGHLRIKTEGKPKIYQVKLIEAVKIKPETIYTASAFFDSNYPYATYYGIMGKRIVTVTGPVVPKKDDDNQNKVQASNNRTLRIRIRAAAGGVAQAVAALAVAAGAPDAPQQQQVHQQIVMGVPYPPVPPPHFGGVMAHAEYQQALAEWQEMQNYMGAHPNHHQYHQGPGPHVVVERPREPEKPKPTIRQKVTFIFFRSEKEAYLDTGGEAGQIPHLLFKFPPTDE